HALRLAGQVHAQHAGGGVIGDAEAEKAGPALRVHQTRVTVVDDDLGHAGRIARRGADGGSNAVLDDRHSAVVDGGTDVGRGLLRPARVVVGPQLEPVAAARNAHAAFLVGLGDRQLRTAADDLGDVWVRAGGHVESDEE